MLLTVLRFIQGVGAGGEWGGSVLLAMEWARHDRERGLLASWPQFGVPAGLFLANLAVLAFSALSGDQFLVSGCAARLHQQGHLGGVRRRPPRRRRPRGRVSGGRLNPATSRRWLAPRCKGQAVGRRAAVPASPNRSRRAASRRRVWS